MTDIVVINPGEIQNSGGGDFDIEELIRRFLADQDIRQKSKDAYRNSLIQYFDWIRKKGFLISNVTRAEILIYKEELMASDKSKLTVGAYTNSVRRFYEWAEAVKLYPNVAKGIRAPKRKNAFKKESLLPDQVKLLLDYFKNKSLRDFAIINLIVRCGLRTIEVSRLRVGDIVFKSGARILMIHGKGKDEKDDFVLLTEKSYLPIKEYLASRKDIKDSSPIFISQSTNGTMGNPIDPKYISGIAKEGLVAIGLDGKQYTAHSLRHTTASGLLRSGATMDAIQAVLRHASPATTQIYTASAKDENRILNKTESMLDDLF